MQIQWVAPQLQWLGYTMVGVSPICYRRLRVSSYPFSGGYIKKSNGLANNNIQYTQQLNTPPNSRLLINIEKLSPIHNQMGLQIKIRVKTYRFHFAGRNMPFRFLELYISRLQIYRAVLGIFTAVKPWLLVIPWITVFGQLASKC